MSITGLLQDFVPTYGNYGGPDYSGGVFVLPGQQPNYDVPPIDNLDALFRQHDIGSGAPTSAGRADADLALIEGIRQLNSDTLTPEGHLWAGAATLAMIADITIRQHHPEKLTPNEALDFSGEAFQHIAQSGVDPFSPSAVAVENSLEQAWSWTSHLNVFDGIF
jgi:hypothetical protein